MNNIIIIPGSYKPPHKGHLSLIEKLIKKYTNSKIIIIISRKPRTLDKRFQYMEQKSKLELQHALIDYFPNEKDDILKLSKINIIKKINKLIENNQIKSINSEQSLKIWNIYLKYLKEKYKNIPKIIFKISETNNIIQNTTRTMLQSFRETPKPNKIILMKSEKNKENKRFNFIEKLYKKYIKILLFPNIKDIDSTGMRESILNNDKNKFILYLPNDLKNSSKNNIWKIVNIQ
jgi:cytidyltransferase-like protein